MEIEFNTSRIANRDSSQPVAKRETTPSVSDTTSFTAAASLEAKLSDAYAVRPEMVEKAKSLLAIPNYPPAELLDRIAALLAVHNKK